MEQITDVPSSTDHCILTEVLGKRKICARFVSHLLTGDQQMARILHCLDMKSAADADPNFLKKHRQWCFQYELEYPQLYSDKSLEKDDLQIQN